MTSIVAISDMHGYLPEPARIPNSDLIIIAGDVTPVWDHAQHFQKSWLKHEFSKWLKDLQRPVIGIAGNHDFYAQANAGFMAELPWTYLQDEATEFNGLKIWGSPWVTKLHGWAFCTTEDVMSDKIDQIDKDIDILISHAPPYGIRDGLKFTNEHVGSTSLATRLTYDKWPNLKNVVFGHIHEGFGHERVMDIDFYNVSYLNERYNSNNPNGSTLFFIDPR